MKSKDENELQRVILNPEATKSLKAMTNSLKAENRFVSFHASEFVSHLVIDFYQTYFDRDIGVYIAEFFDSESYYQEMMKHARNNGSFEEVMTNAMGEIKRIKNKKRGKQGRKRKVTKENNANDYEAI